MSYSVNEVFYSVQGEGVRAGTANVFVRFSGCNLQCSVDARIFRGESYEAGFDCDTEFMSGRITRFVELGKRMEEVGGACRACILTGGEPALQTLDVLVLALKKAGWYVAIETNGTISLPDGIDWICVSPKTAWHTLRVGVCNELKLVRHAGQELPTALGGIESEHLLVSPACDPDGRISRENLRWCIDLVKRNPAWRLSCQQHKAWAVR